jgi:hypothetical protein
MPVALYYEDDNTYRLECAGVLRRTELTECEAELALAVGVTSEPDYRREISP